MLPMIRRSWSPLRDFAELHQEVDRLFGEFSPTESINSINQKINRSFSLACDVEESEDHYLLSFDLPGVAKEDIKVEALDQQITISGERKPQEKNVDRKGRAYLTERSYGRFQRSFTLPVSINVEQIEAQYRDGVLQLAVPKAASAKPRQIQIGEAKAGIFNKLLGNKTHKEGGHAA